MRGGSALSYTTLRDTTPTTDYRWARLPLGELAAKSGDADFLRAIAESVLQLIMEADVDGLIGAGRYERGEARQPDHAGAVQTWRHVADQLRARWPKLRGFMDRCRS